MVRVVGELAFDNTSPVVNKRDLNPCLCSTIRYLHVLRPEGAAVTGRRCSMPAVSSVAPAPPDRRGSQPAVLQAGLMPRPECSRPRSFALPVSTHQDDAGQQADQQPQGDWCFPSDPFFFLHSLLTFFTGSDSLPGTPSQLEQNSEVPQVFHEKCFYEEV